MSRRPQEVAEHRTRSGLPIKAFYGPEDVGQPPARPGEYPFTRGIHPTMYRGKPWTMRQYAGFGTPEETNQRFKYLLKQGQTGLSLALDLPTQLGLDSDDPEAVGEVGKAGGTMSKMFELGQMPTPGEVPSRMKAVVIRRDREGEPERAMQVEELPLPECGPGDVLVMVMGAGVNFNGVWAARGKPVSVFKMHSDPFHIAGSDASGIVWKVGSSVRRWKVGDQVVVHCNQSCGQCPECNGLDPMACGEQRIWGYETNWGSFAQFTRVQAQQLLPKPASLSWMEAACYGLTYFTAYRMLVHQAELKAGDDVLIWGAAGGLGIFAIQLCKVMGANPIGVVSSPAKARLVRALGCEWVIDRSEFDFTRGSEGSVVREKHRAAEMRRFGGAIRQLTGGRDPDVVFEHVGRETFPTSVFVAKRFGKIVICGATSGYNLDFDVRHLWMRQKQILGSHFCNAYQAQRANKLVMEGKIAPVLDQVFPFERTAEAHARMADNRHMGKLAIAIQAPFEEAQTHQDPLHPPGSAEAALGPMQ